MSLYPVLEALHDEARKTKGSNFDDAFKAVMEFTLEEYESQKMLIK